MSYRERRNFTEMMRALGYNRLISMENFRTANFPLVAEVLVWLVQMFQPDADIHTESTSEEDRVLLIRSVAQFMAVNAGVKLNTKWLYQADDFAVKELLKISGVLYSALRSEHTETQNDSNTSSSALDISSRLADFKLARELASHITTKGAALYTLLGQEPRLREARVGSVRGQVEVAGVEEGLRGAVEGARINVSNTTVAIHNIAATEASLDSKIEKRQQDLERNQKRLQTLKKVRPAFLEEFERAEVELRRLHQDYVARFRCQAVLEQQLDDAELAEHERIEQRQAETRKMLERMRQEEALKLLDDAFEPTSLYELQTSVIAPQPEAVPPASISRVRTSTSTGHRVYGGMTVEEEDSLEDTDSDLLHDDDDDDSQLLSAVIRDDLSDDDF